MRYTTENDVYNISFVAFIASRFFIQEEFRNNISDLEFEKKYLKCDSRNDFINKCILKKNIFHIMAGIDAGKWNNHVLRILKKNYSDIKWAEREKTVASKTVFNDFALFFQMFLSKKQRRKMKMILTKFFDMKFVTKY